MTTSSMLILLLVSSAVFLPGQHAAAAHRARGGHGERGTQQRRQGHAQHCMSGAAVAMRLSSLLDNQCLYLRQHAVQWHLHACVVQINAQLLLTSRRV